MPWLSLRHAALIALAAAPCSALGQTGGANGSPAVLSFGVAALGAEGAAAIGAGLRLFPAPASAVVTVPMPSPVVATTPAPAVAPRPVLPSAKPVAAGVAAAAPLPAGKPEPLSRQAAAPAARPTAFTPSAEVSARVREQVLAAALPGSPDPAALRASVEAGRPWQEFDRLLAAHGYDSRDLADVVAAFYLIAWEVATGGDATVQPAGIAAVRGQARQMLASAPNLAGLSEAERQATAETLAFHAMAMAARHQDLRTGGSGAAMVSYRQEVAAAVVQQHGIDIRRFALTPAGFQAL